MAGIFRVEQVEALPANRCGAHYDVVPVQNPSVHCVYTKSFTDRGLPDKSWRVGSVRVGTVFAQSTVAVETVLSVEGAPRKRTTADLCGSGLIWSNFFLNFLRILLPRINIFARGICTGC